MIYVGLDDTDTTETPGTVKLAMHLAGLLSGDFDTPWIVRHQLLEDPRVPCTNRNGCVSMCLVPRGAADVPALIDTLRRTLLSWCPAGSDPGLCVTESVPPTLSAWGHRVQRELVQMSDAEALARQSGVYLEPLGGTGGGIIGALSAVGLLATWNSGRVVYRGTFGAEALDVRGCFTAAELQARGVDQIVSLHDQSLVTSGTIELGKRLRPNLREGRAVLYVARDSETEADWLAQRVVA